MHRKTLRFRRALGLGAAAATMLFAGAYAVGSAAVNTAAPVDEHGAPDVVPAGPASLPTQAADRAREAVAERGRDAHAQGPKDVATTEAAPTGESGEDAEGAGPGYGPGNHAGPHGDYGPDNHPDSENHPGNQPGSQPGNQP